MSFKPQKGRGRHRLSQNCLIYPISKLKTFQHEIQENTIYIETKIN